MAIRKLENIADADSSNGRTGEELHRREYVGGDKRPSTRTQRTKLQSALLGRVKPNTIQLSKKLTGIEKKDAGGVELRFKDGTVVVADLVVGADGIRSVCLSDQSQVPLLILNRLFATPHGQTMRSTSQALQSGEHCFRGMESKIWIPVLRPRHGGMDQQAMCICPESARTWVRLLLGTGKIQPSIAPRRLAGVCRSAMHMSSHSFRYRCHFLATTTATDSVTGIPPANQRGSYQSSRRGLARIRCLCRSRVVTADSLGQPDSSCGRCLPRSIRCLWLRRRVRNGRRMDPCSSSAILQQ